MKIGSKLRELRERNNLSVKDAVIELSKFGITISEKTLYGYESGKNSTNADMFLALCQIYNCKNISREFSGSTDDVLFTNDEWNLIEKYRNLDQCGKKTVDTVIDREIERVVELKKLQKKNNELEEKLQKASIPKRIFAYYGKIAAAGIGIGFSDMIAGTKEYYLTDDNKNADYTIGVSGNSMEDTYYDGDIVFVKKQNHINIGDIGIFQKNNMIYIKEAGEKGLISHNQNYDPIIDETEVICLGKVIGKVTEDMIIQD